MDRDELMNTVAEFSGYIDGFIHGAQLDLEPHIFIKVKSALYEYQELINKQTAIA